MRHYLNIMRFTTAYNHLTQTERDFVDSFLNALIRENEKHLERLAVTLDRWTSTVDFELLDEQTRFQFQKALVGAAIREKIDKYDDENSLLPERVVKANSQIAFANIKNFFAEIGQDGIPIFDAQKATEADWFAVQSIDIEENFGPRGNKRTVKIRMHAKQPAIDSLAKWNGLDKSDNSLNSNYANNYSANSKVERSTDLVQLASRYTQLIGE